jgi:GTPase SAR1 family protein
MSFGQLVIGPPGSGKTTYCRAIKEYYEYFGRKTVLVNLDPANDTLTKGKLYNKLEFNIDIRDLITLDNIEGELKLGPNSSFLYSFNFLEKNLSWLTDKLVDNKYYIFDTPGQIEIFTVSAAFKGIVKQLNKNIRLCCVNLIESFNIVDMSKYIFSIFSVLNGMINLELPQINVRNCLYRSYRR